MAEKLKNMEEIMTELNMERQKERDKKRKELVNILEKNIMEAENDNPFEYDIDRLFELWQEAYNDYLYECNKKQHYEEVLEEVVANERTAMENCCGLMNRIAKKLGFKQETVITDDDISF